MTKPWPLEIVVVCITLLAASCNGSEDKPAIEAGPNPPSSTATASGSLFVGEPRHSVVDPTLSAGEDNPAPAGPAAGPDGKPTPTSTAGKGKGNGETTASSSSTTTATTTPPGLPAESCPDAKRCRRYGYTPNQPMRWPSGQDGRTPIRFKVFPHGSRTSLSTEQVEAAINQAFLTWAKAAPSLKVVYEGLAERPPTSGDGENTVGFGFGPYPSVSANTIGAPDGSFVEADIFLGVANFVWHPCEQRDDSCTPVNDQGRIDLQAITTHEVGHWLGLADMPDQALERELTMHPGSGDQLTKTTRQWVTLALGDVLGIRSLYPCSCPLPPIYSP